MLTRLAVAALALSACAFDGAEAELGPDAGDPTVDAADDALPEDPTFATGALHEWVWNDIEGATCGNGGRTGIGVSLGASDDMLVYLEGDGICWDEASCALAAPRAPGANGFPLPAYFNVGFTGDTFRSLVATGRYASGIFDRTLANNPYKDATFVFVPDCTGDAHTGSTQVDFPITQRAGRFSGRTNLVRALSALSVYLPPPGRVTLAGTGAGAYGATLNYPLVADVFESARVDLVADSGPLLPASPYLQRGYAAWDTKAIIPSDCPACVTSFDRLYGYYATAYPTSRFAFISHAEDLVIAAGHDQAPHVFAQTLKSFTQDVLGPLPTWRSFVSAGTAHTSVYQLEEPSIQTGPVCVFNFLGFCLRYETRELSRTVLADWLGQMHADAAWSSVTSQ